MINKKEMYRKVEVDDELSFYVPPRFEPGRFLIFVDECRKAGICLPNQNTERRELNQSSYYPKGHPGRRRYWAGHKSDAKIYWFTFPNDVGALTHFGCKEIPAVTVPIMDECNICNPTGSAKPWKIFRLLKMSYNL